LYHPCSSVISHYISGPLSGRGGISESVGTTAAGRPNYIVSIHSYTGSTLKSRPYKLPSHVLRHLLAVLGVFTKPQLPAHRFRCLCGRPDTSHQWRGGGGL